MDNEQVLRQIDDTNTRIKIIQNYFSCLGYYHAKGEDTMALYSLFAERGMDNVYELLNQSLDDLEKASRQIPLEEKE